MSFKAKAICIKCGKPYIGVGELNEEDWCWCTKYKPSEILKEADIDWDKAAETLKTDFVDRTRNTARHAMTFLMVLFVMFMLSSG